MYTLTLTETLPVAEGFALIPTALIDDPARPLRSDLTPESVAELIVSIKQMGIIEPIILRPANGRFETIAGHRRLYAAQIAKLEQIPCIVRKLGNEETEIMKIHENLYREDISPSDEAKHYDYLIQHLKLSPAKVAALVGRSPSYISERLAIFNYPPELKRALDDKKIVFSVAREFAHHPDTEKIRQFLRYAVSNGCTPTVARQWVQDDIRALEQRSNPAAPSSGEYPTEEVQTSSYNCTLCEEPIEIAKLTVVYLHDLCHQDLKKAIASTPSSPEIPAAPQQPTA